MKHFKRKLNCFELSFFALNLDLIIETLKKLLFGISFSFLKSKTDFLIGGLGNNKYTQRYFSSSWVYYADDLTWCVNRVEPSSFWFQMRHVATKLIYLLLFILVGIGCAVILCCMRFETDKFGYMKYNFSNVERKVIQPFIEITESQLFVSNNSIPRILFAILMTTGILVTCVWNCLLLKIITLQLPGYQIRTIHDLIEHNFRLTGGPFSNVSVWEESNVNVQKSLNLNAYQFK